MFIFVKRKKVTEKAIRSFNQIYPCWAYFKIVATFSVLSIHAKLDQDEVNYLAYRNRRRRTCA